MGWSPPPRAAAIGSERRAERLYREHEQHRRDAPRQYCVEFHLPRGSTYAMAVWELAGIADMHSN